MATNVQTISNLSSTVFTVRSNAELKSVLQTIESQGGGTIKLDPAGGPYQIAASGLGSASAPIVIKSLYPNWPTAVDDISLTGASHVTISGLDIQGREAGTPQTIRVSGSDNVTLTGNIMTGVADGFQSETGKATVGNGAGLFRDSTNIVITDNVVSHFGSGFGILEINGLTFSGNELSYLQRDGLQGGGIRNAEISDNYFHDFYGSTQTINHSDMIQIWGANASTLTANIVITRNVLDAGSGALSQAIFIGNERFGQGTADVNGRFQNITITENVIHNGASNGIAVTTVNGLVVQSNTLLLNEASYMYTGTGRIEAAEPRFQITNSLNITATNNLGSKYLGQIDSTKNYTLVYDNQSDAMYVGNHIINLSGTGDTDLRDLMIRMDSVLWGQAGASLSSDFRTGDDGMLAIVSSSEVAGNAMAVAFDAGYSAMPEGAVIKWHFSDGQVLTGEVVQRVFTSIGSHEVRLVITDKAGNSDTVTRMFHIDDPVLFDFNFAGGATDSSTYDAEVTVTGESSLVFVKTLVDQGFHLTTGTGLTLGKNNHQIHNLEAFNLDLRFRQDAGDGYGGLVGMHTALYLDIGTDGSLSFQLRTDEGTFKVQTSGGIMSNTKWHDISAQYDGLEGTLSIVVDGVVRATGAATGVTDGPLPWGLQLGRPFGVNAQGVFEDISMTLPSSSVLPVDIGDSPDVNVTAPVVVDVPYTAPDDIVETPKEDIGLPPLTSYDGPIEIQGEQSQKITDADMQISGVKSFNIAFDFRQDKADGSGGLLNHHTILDLEVRPDGGLTLRFNSDLELVVLNTSAGLLSDTKQHSINLIYSSSRSELSILVDGQEAATASISGRTAAAEFWSLTVGDPWHDSVDGVVSNLEITTGQNDNSKFGFLFSNGGSHGKKGFDPDADISDGNGYNGPSKLLWSSQEDDYASTATQEAPTPHFSMFGFLL